MVPTARLFQRYSGGDALLGEILTTVFVARVASRLGAVSTAEATSEAPDLHDVSSHLLRGASTAQHCPRGCAVIRWPRGSIA